MLITVFAFPTLYASGYIQSKKFQDNRTAMAQIPLFNRK